MADQFEEDDDVSLGKRRPGKRIAVVRHAPPGRPDRDGPAGTVLRPAPKRATPTPTATSTAGTTTEDAGEDAPGFGPGLALLARRPGERGPRPPADR